MGAVTTWKRPYRDPLRVLTGFIAVSGSAIACVVAVAFFVGHPAQPWARLPPDAFVAFWLTFAWRLHRTALVISDSGVRVPWLLKTRTVTWYEIKEFRYDDDVLRVDRLWIDLADGRRVRTPVQRVARRWNGSQLSDGWNVAPLRRFR